MLMQGSVGSQQASAGSTPILRMGEQSDLIASQLHGRFYEQTARRNVYSSGATLTSIANATYGTLTSTTTPIIGVWNPLSNTKNLVILQAQLAVTITALAATGPAPFIWTVSTNNGAITTGAVPFNRATLVQSGSNARGFGGGIALTGLTNNLVVFGGSALYGGSASNASFTATAVAMQTQASSSVENFDGSLIIPPGGVLALISSTTAVAHSVTSNLVWEEVPILSS